MMGVFGMNLGLFKRREKQVETETPRIYTASAFTAVREVRMAVCETSKQAALQKMQAFVVGPWLTELSEADSDTLFQLVKEYGASAMDGVAAKDLRFILDDETLQSLQVEDQDAALLGQVQVLTVLQRGGEDAAAAEETGVLVLHGTPEEGEEVAVDDDDDGILDPATMLGAPVLAEVEHD